MNTRALRALLRLVADAGSAESVASYRAELLVALAEALPCDLLVWNEFPIGGRLEPMGHTQPRDAISPALQAMFALHMLEHPLILDYAAGDRQARRLSDAISLRALHGLGSTTNSSDRSASSTNSRSVSLGRPAAWSESHSTARGATSMTRTCC
jgi:hypothetical protein